MLGLLMRLFGRRIAHKAVATHVREGGALDIKLGFALLRDRRVPIGAKLLSLLLGFALVALLIELELPLEALLAVVLPFFGLGLDSILDGLEVVIGPFIVAALLLPFLAPKPLVTRIRAERAGLDLGPIIEEAATTPQATTMLPTEMARMPR